MSTTTLPTVTTLPTTTTDAWDGPSLGRRLAWRAQGIFVRHSDKIVVSVLLLAGLVLRLTITRGFWLDEATSVGQAKMSLFRMISYMRQSDVHPPLFQLVLWVDVRVFGMSELAVRLPSIVTGTLVIPVLYFAGRDLFDRRTGLIAAFVGALDPVAIWYSQEARMYPIFMLFSLLAVWTQVKAVRTGNWKAWAGYTLATVALMWTHYFSVLHVLVQQLAFLVLLWKGRGTQQGKRLFAGWWRSTLVIFLLVAPLLSITAAQLDNYGTRGATPAQTAPIAQPVVPVYSAVSNFASAVLGYHSASTMTKLNALWPLSMLAALMALGRGRSRVTMLLVSLIAVPMGVLFVVGLKRNDVFELRYFVGAVPAICLLLARGITTLVNRRTTMTLTTAAIATTMLFALVDEQHSGDNTRVYDFRGALHQIDAQRQAGDVMFYEPFYLHPTIHYYAPKFDSLPLVAGLQTTASAKRVIIVDSLVFSDEARSASRVQLVVDRLGQSRKLVEHISQNHIEIWVFA